MKRKEKIKERKLRQRKSLMDLLPATASQYRRENFKPSRGRLASYQTFFKMETTHKTYYKKDSSKSVDYTPTLKLPAKR